MIDLDLRSSRLEKDQQKRLDDARKKRAKEAQQQREHIRREEEMTKRAVQRRAEQEQAEMEKQIAEEDERRITGGIRFSHQLKPYEIEGEDDKVILPEECLAELTQQDAFGRGALTFQLCFKASSNKETSTHCGVREFSAPAGTIGIPKKVIDSLDTDIADISLLSIKFVLLPKCTFAKLQPKHNTFIEVGPVKQCLEENLRFHTSLTVGDQLTVWYRGKAHVLCVTEMKPDRKGSLVDTDVEIDLELSEEFLTHQHNKELEKSGTARTLGRGSPMEVDSQPQTQTQAQPQSQSLFGFSNTAPNSSLDTSSSAVESYALHNVNEANSMDSVPLQTQAQTQAALSALLRAEPSAQEKKESVAIKIKLPSGQTRMRRFEYTSEVRQLFLFAALEIVNGGTVTPDETSLLNKLQVSTRFPARALRYSDVSSSMDDSGSHKSFSDVGLNVSSESVFVTLV